MEHIQTVNTMATERYLLDEMSAAERDEFEEHFFSCSECAADVRDGRRLLDAGRALSRSASRTETGTRSRSMLAPWAVAASIALVAVVGYQNLVTIPRLDTARTAASTPRVVRSVSLLTAGTRGDAGIVVSHGDEPFTLTFDILPQARSYSRYRCSIRDAAGSLHASVFVAASEANDPVQMLVPAGALQPGDYHLTVDGVSGSQFTEIENLSFSVKAS